MGITGTGLALKADGSYILTCILTSCSPLFKVSDLRLCNVRLLEQWSSFGRMLFPAPPVTGVGLSSRDRPNFVLFICILYIGFVFIFGQKQHCSFGFRPKI